MLNRRLVVVVLCCLLSIASASAETPPSFTEWQPAAVPLDLLPLVDGLELAESSPSLWCPSGDDLTTWLEARQDRLTDHDLCTATAGPGFIYRDGKGDSAPLVDIRLLGYGAAKTGTIFPEVIETYRDGTLVRRDEVEELEVVPRPKAGLFKIP